MTFEGFLNSEIRSRLIKFFVYNHTKFFEIREVAKRLGLPSRSVLRHLKILEGSGVVKSKSSRSFSISYKFPYLNELRNLVLKFPPVSDEWILKKAKRIKRLKALIIAGTLVHAEKARVEVLIVGDRIQERTAEKFMRAMESQAAKELRYALLTTQEFLYRKKMFDRFVLDVLEYPHRILINKLKFKGV